MAGGQHDRRVDGAARRPSGELNRADAETEFGALPRRGRCCSPGRRRPARSGGGAGSRVGTTSLSACPAQRLPRSGRARSAAGGGRGERPGQRLEHHIALAVIDVGAAVPGRPGQGVAEPAVFAQRTEHLTADEPCAAETDYQGSHAHHAAQPQWVRRARNRPGRGRAPGTVVIVAASGAQARVGRGGAGPGRAPRLALGCPAHRGGLAAGESVGGADCVVIDRGITAAGIDGWGDFGDGIAAMTPLSNAADVPTMNAIRSIRRARRNPPEPSRPLICLRTRSRATDRGGIGGA